MRSHDIPTRRFHSAQRTIAQSPNTQQHTATLRSITTATARPPNADMSDNEIVALVIILFVFLPACGLFSWWMVR
jgi:hypothetical protein